MKSSQLPVKTLDYRQVNAANSLLHTPSMLSSSGWKDIHFELFQQSKFEIAEYQHTMHVIACGIPYPQTEKMLDYSSGERWLDGKLKTETRNISNIACLCGYFSSM